MNRELERNFDNEQLENIDMNTKRKGESIMKKDQCIREFEHQDSQTENGSPKKLKVTYPSRNETARRLSSHNVRGSVGIAKTTIKGLQGSRVCVRVEVDRFGWRSEYQGRRKPTISVKDARLKDYGNLLVKNQLWLTRGKWAQNLGIGDIIELEARLENGELKNPTKVRLVKSGRRDVSAQRARTSAQSGTEGSGIQMVMF